MKAGEKSIKNKLFKIEKRLFDLALSMVFLITLAPLFCVVAIGIKFTSSGPIFFRQRRIGLAGKEYICLKFRTMTVDATEVHSGPVFAMQNDPRITPFGIFLRKTAIDELPALISVLKGDLSIVGPRSSFPLEIKHYTEEQKKRFCMKPGLTGYWQTYGRENGVTDFHKMIEMDLEYIKIRSLWLDLKIIFKTVGMSLSSRGAY